MGSRKQSQKPTRHSSLSRAPNLLLASAGVPLGGPGKTSQDPAASPRAISPRGRHELPDTLPGQQGSALAELGMLRDWVG